MPDRRLRHRASRRCCAASTCSRTINAGRIWIEGTEITGRGVNVNRVRRRVGIVFQAFNLFPHMSVLRNITLAPRKVLHLSAQEAEAQAMELLSRFGLADKATSIPTDYRAASSSERRSCAHWP